MNRDFSNFIVQMTEKYNFIGIVSKTILCYKLTIKTIHVLLKVQGYFLSFKTDNNVLTEKQIVQKILKELKESIMKKSNS